MKSVRFLFLIFLVVFVASGVFAARYYVNDQVSTADCSGGLTTEGTFKDGNNNTRRHCVQSAEYVSGQDFILSAHLERNQVLETCAVGTAYGWFLDAYNNKTSLCEVKGLPLAGSTVVVNSTFVIGSCPAGYNESGNYTNGEMNVTHYCVLYAVVQGGTDNPVPVVTNCTDEDGSVADMQGRVGFDANVKGRVFPDGRKALTGPTAVYIDYCINEKNLTEFYCNVTGMVQREIVNCENNCAAGKCLGLGEQETDDTPVAGCFESSTPKKNASLAGYVEYFDSLGAGARFYDACNTTERLHEYTCNSYAGARSDVLLELIDCNCSAAICLLPGETPPQPPTCNSNGTCDAGETTANCQSDCPAPVGRMCNDSDSKNGEVDSLYASSVDSKPVDHPSLFTKGSLTLTGYSDAEKANIQIEDRCNIDGDGKWLLEVYCSASGEPMSTGFYCPGCNDGKCPGGGGFDFGNIGGALMMGAMMGLMGFMMGGNPMFGIIGFILGFIGGLGGGGGLGGLFGGLGGLFGG